MEAKSVFEPLHYDIDQYRGALEHDFALPQAREGYLNMYMPYAKDGLDSRAELNTYVRNSLTGAVTEPWTQGPRREVRKEAGRESDWKAIDVVYRVREALRTSIVTKFVRAHLLIPALHKTFDPVIVHLRRDPRAVIASFKRLEWTWYKSLSLEDQLLKPDDGREEYFDRWREDIQKYESAPPLMRVAAYWAFVERFVDDLAPHSRRVVLSYEELCLNPESVQQGPVGKIVPEAPSASQMGYSSRTTQAARREAKVEERVHGWKNELDKDEIEMVTSIESDIGVFIGGVEK
ncbi:hypothetical protein GGP93_001169 [Salinibacter ruber]|nr:hypothetical protein [Salinibacter ruber]